MPSSSLRLAAPVLLSVAVCAPASANPGSFQTVYTFGAASGDGVAPMSRLIVRNGLLYGTTFRGGPSGDGTVYAFDPATAAETIVTTAMGIFPFAPVLYEKDVLFGTTAAADNGQGNIYSVDLKSGQVANLYTFSRGEDQASPGALVGLGGKLYGTTFNAGNFNDGSVFEYDPVTSTYSTLYSFTAGTDGKNPQGLTVNAGLLYGVTTEGGSGGGGTVFTVDPATGAETTLHALASATDGSSPSGITFRNHMIYGTASFGGMNNDGTLFSLDPTTKRFSTIFTFPGGAGGCIPGGQPVIDGGRIYGITNSCGDAANQGTLYELTIKTGKQKILHTFTNGPDGVSPAAALLPFKGALYGTASYGGTYNAGTIFKYVP